MLALDHDLYNYETSFEGSEGDHDIDYYEASFEGKQNSKLVDGLHTILLVEKGGENRRKYLTSLAHSKDLKAELALLRVAKGGKIQIKDEAAVVYWSLVSINVVHCV
ncbi:hypothetical protein POTOM_028918 [Populus tomentosa]|uniref:Uncharacterized protein n=1 Tax=Populus tomentosa TaxID=118781 RepID=A0A8X8CW96_POPTO|nr:hypothetical protein POTOM_028918 [Populus tomentosa]